MVSNDAIEYPNLGPNKYDGEDLFFFYDPQFTITTNSLCQSGIDAVSCNSVTGSKFECVELDENGLASYAFQLSDYISQSIPPGTYTVSYDVSTSAGKESGVTD